MCLHRLIYRKVLLTPLPLSVPSTSPVCKLYPDQGLRCPLHVVEVGHGEAPDYGLYPQP